MPSTITFDANGNMVLPVDTDAYACPTDPQDANQCESCQ